MGPLRYDVVVLGGALAGASTALLLRRRRPELRVLVIEKSERFDWKVGESTVETSGYFLTRVLRITDHLSREQLPKQGLRYWFHHGAVKRLEEASEVGGNQLTRLPAFQLDRAKLDEHVLDLAAREGAELWRPAKVAEVFLPEERGAAEGLVRVEHGGKTLEVEAGWIVDASGRSALLARKRGWLRPLEEHPTSAVWARYRNVKDLDGPEVAGTDPDSPFGSAVVASRRLATNHFNGYGYWIWLIPLRGGETSVGVVWDRRLVQPRGEGAEERLRWFLAGNPLTRRLMEGAERVPDDLWSFAHVPYLVDRVAGKGWSCAGDAAGFLDPFYSPGIDQVAFSVWRTLDLIDRGRSGPDPAEFAAFLEEHNRLYASFFRCYFEAIYRDKYHLMGDYDAMTTSFLVDTALYYFFVAIPVYRRGGEKLLKPPFYDRYAGVPMTLISAFRRRLVAVARRKMKLGIYGDGNSGRRPKFMGFSLGLGAWTMLLHGLARWARLELANAWTYVARPRPLKAGLPEPLAVPQTAEPVPPPFLGAGETLAPRP
jgi:flavin-dependent dehydrogenase